MAPVPSGARPGLRDVAAAGCAGDPAPSGARPDAGGETAGERPGRPRATGLVALLVAAVAPLLAGCSASRPPVPLRPEPVPFADTLPIPEPEGRSADEAARLVEEALWAELTEPFDLRRMTGTRREALNVTRFDDVVGSAWWRRRIGYRRMTPEEVARGPTDAGPDTSGALTVVAGKTTGVTPGFTVRDARGDRYLLKFDPPGFPHLASSADVIASRIFWAAGYNTPEEYKVVFDSARLRVAPGATVETPAGDRPMTRADVHEVLGRVAEVGDGRFVAAASEFVPGTPKGPFRFEGVRDDDPNDHYLHQFRRELRGLYVVSAWVNHFDMRFANTLDSYVGPGYLRHYLIDFAGALGSETLEPHRPRSGREHNFDLWPVLGRLVTLGFFRVGWEGEAAEVIDPSVGWLRAEGFDPAGWHPNWPNEAFRQMTVRDGYWAAKLVAAFDDDDVRAAVAAGELPREAAADTLTAILLHRRDRTVAHWFSRVSPVEDPRSSRAPPDAGAPGLRVSFVDLGLEEGLRSPGRTRYRWRLRHAGRGVDVRGETAARPRRRQVLDVGTEGARPLPDPSPREALARLEITAVRPGADERPAVVHLRWRGPERGYTVEGLEH